MDCALLLASSSITRAKLLKSAGLHFLVKKPYLDEFSLKQSLIQENLSIRDIADVLAEQKAKKVSLKHMNSYVIGCDQTLEFKGKLIDKAETIEELKSQLDLLKGEKHHLYSAAVIYYQGEPIWRSIGKATLYMRAFSQNFLDDYVKSNGDDLLHSVGGYHIEAAGIQLFDQIIGDYFTILGMPLLEILGFLRTRKLLVE